LKPITILLLMPQRCSASFLRHSVEMRAMVLVLTAFTTYCSVDIVTCLRISRYGIVNFSKDVDSFKKQCSDIPEVFS